MSTGYLVTLGPNGQIDIGDAVALSQTAFTVDVLLGTGSVQFTNAFMTGTQSFNFYRGTDGNVYASDASFGVSPSPTSAQVHTFTPTAVCFAEGTLIATVSGAVPIESVMPGDLVLTRDNGPKPLLWSARRRLGHADLMAAPHLCPVEIAADAFGNDRPLLVSPQHGILLKHDGQEVLTRAIHLARQKSGKVRQRNQCRNVTYWHLFFEQHQIVFSNGLATESLFPGPQALISLPPDARRELAELLPEMERIKTLSTARRFYGDMARPYSRTHSLPDHISAFSPVL